MLPALTVNLHSASEPARGALGGKGAGLAALASAGLPVPPGFCLTTAAYRAVMEGLASNSDESPALALRAASLPPEVGQALAAAYAGLGDAKAGVAVRSSATVEDGDQVSHAGQQSTRLSVTDLDGVVDAVRQCWASLWEERAVAYRRGVASAEGDEVEMGVVVQRMVPAEIAGVLFTADPTGGGSEQMLASSAFGLGEAVVGGGAVDTYALRRSDGAILARAVSDKRTMLLPHPSGGVRAVEVDPDRAATDSLDTDLARRLVALGLAVEDVLGHAADIEWAVAGGQLYVLQARPVTTATRARRTVWSSINVGEALPGVATPMTWSIIHRFSKRGFDRAFAALGLRVPSEYGLIANVRGRVYLNLTEFMSIASQIPLLSPATLLSLGGGGDPRDLEDAYERHSALGFVARLPLTLPRIAWSQLRAPRRAEAHARRFKEAKAEWLATDLRGLPGPALRDSFRALNRLFEETGDVMLACGANALSSYALVRSLLRRAGEGAAREERRLFSGLTGLRSAEPGLELLRLAGLALDAPVVRAAFEAHDLPESCDALLAHLSETPSGRRFRRRFDGFLAEHGLRAARDAELSTPRWSEDPSFTLSVIATHVRRGEVRNPDRLLAECEAERAEAEARALAAAPRPLRAALRAALPVARQAARLREQLRECVTESLSFFRIHLLEAGRRMAADELLGAADDVFLLSYDEVEAWLAGDGRDHRRSAMERRALQDADRRAPDPPDTFVVGGRAVPAVAVPAPGDATLKGLPAGPGVYEGPCRVVRRPEEGAALQAGEILIAPATDVGWTPLFLLAGAVVMDQGGPLSHAAVVAREYGLPAVVNVKRGCATLRTGQRVRVDGDRGTITLLPPAPPRPDRVEL